MKLKKVIRFSLIISLLLSVADMQAQKEQRTLTLEEYTAGSPKYIYPKYIRGLQWQGENCLSWHPEGIMVRAPKDKDWRLLLTLEEFNKLLREAKTEQSARQMPSVKALSREEVRIDYNDAILVVNTQEKRLVRHFATREKMQALKLDASSRQIAYVRGNNLFVENEQGQVRQVTHDGSPEIVYGQTVHQSEFGISEGLFWSPDGAKLAFYRMDQSMVKPYPILHVDAERPYSQMQYYPMAGQPIHHVKLGIYDLKSGKTTYLNTPDPSQTYLTNVAWAPNSKEVFIAELNRQQTDISLNAYSVVTGQLLRTLFTEHDDVYAEPLKPPYFLPGQEHLFLWYSRRDGYSHYYLYNTDGKLIRQLTKGNWDVTALHGVSPDGKTLYYTSTQVSPLERHLYSLPTSGGKPKQLTKETGYHRVQLSDDKRYYIDSYEAVDIALGINLCTTSSGEKLATLVQGHNTDDDYLTPKVELGTIKAADDKTDLYYRIIKPYNFSPTKRYPAIIYVYNGPHAQLIQNRHRAASRGWELNMANEGYIILTVDGRGSANRGRDFEQVIHRNLGVNEMSDQMRGVELLRSLPYIDMDRIGVYGWSYGGFMTTNLMLTYPDIFKVGVAGGPVIDWTRYEAMYGERYMDTPQENPEGYKQSNLLNRVENLKGRLLMIHGTIDPVVIWQHSLLFVQAAVRAGTHPDYMVYPEHEHNVLGPERVHLNQVITRYFKDHL